MPVTVTHSRALFSSKSCWDGSFFSVRTDDSHWHQIDPGHVGLIILCLHVSPHSGLQADVCRRLELKTCGASRCFVTISPIELHCCAFCARERAILTQFKSGMLLIFLIFLPPHSFTESWKKSSFYVNTQFFFWEGRFFVSHSPLASVIFFSKTIYVFLTTLFSLCLCFSLCSSSPWCAKSPALSILYVFYQIYLCFSISENHSISLC